MSKSWTARRAYFWPIAVAGLVVAASSRSTVAGPEIVNIDKVAHFGVYALIATLVCRIRPDWRGALAAAAAVSAFGATDEWHQAFVPGRSPDIGDWIADTSGAVLAVILYVGWGAYRRLLEMPVSRMWRRG